MPLLPAVEIEPPVPGGLLAMSTYFATVDTIELHEANRKLPIRVLHGTVDEVVPETLGQKAVQLLKELGYAPEYVTYGIGHSVSMEELQAIGGYLREWLAE